MNRYQKKVSKKAKLIKSKSDLAYSVCKRYAKIRAIYDAYRIMC